jgi:hypothetical protein
MCFPNASSGQFLFDRETSQQQFAKCGPWSLGSPQNSFKRLVNSKIFLE